MDIAPVSFEKCSTSQAILLVRDGDIHRSGQVAKEMFLLPSYKLSTILTSPFAIWLTAYIMPWRVTCPRYITLPVMSWKRFLSSIRGNLSSGWSRLDSFFHTRQTRCIACCHDIPSAQEGTQNISLACWSPSRSRGYGYHPSQAQVTRRPCPSLRNDSGIFCLVRISTMTVFSQQENVVA